MILVSVECRPAGHKIHILSEVASRIGCGLVCILFRCSVEVQYRAIEVRRIPQIGADTAEIIPLDTRDNL